MYNPFLDELDCSPADEFRRVGLRPLGTLFFSHPGHGTSGRLCPLFRHKSGRRTWEVRNLYVMDSSSFPSASGVNPMISIEAIAHRNASALSSRLA
jgi:hypothetical protein